MGKVRVGGLTLRGCDFVHIAANGAEEIVFTAANEEIAKAISKMIDGVANGSLVTGHAIGYKAGFKAGTAVIGIATIIAGYIAIRVWMAKKSKEEKEEADAE